MSAALPTETRARATTMRYYVEWTLLAFTEPHPRGLQSWET